MSTYTYSLLTNFPVGFNQSVLDLDIKAQVAITASITNIILDGVNVKITFDRALTTSEENALTTIVSTHNPASRIISTDFTIMRHINPISTSGGSITRLVWTTRKLNNIENGSEEVSLNTTTSRFRLAPGRYKISAKAEVASVGDHRLRIQNITTGTTGATGINCTSSQRGELIAVITSSNGTHEWELQQIVGTTRATDGMGKAIGLGGGVEVFTVMNIRPL